ncbi:hypothetical protein AB835_13830 [Candidatus Endobugula sertula]|uniref:Condensation domain-containing protein n=1 Tax=Candidatus Endobugula sertula TaxID=62101 RepID=A0A1D2QLP9_9GAMM|nr:hypothetical protein AB835_13830 [Candidatus Endobugula sertula]
MLKQRFINSLQNDLELLFFEESDQLNGRLEYNTDLYDEALMERVVNSMIKVLSDIIATPDMTLDTIDVLGPNERYQLLTKWLIICAIKA